MKAVYLNSNFEIAERESATIAKLFYPNGNREFIILDQPQGESGKAVKSVAKLTVDYEVDLSNLVADCLNKETTPAYLQKAMLRLIGEYAAKLYAEGMEDGGIKDPLNEFDDTDTERVNDWVSEQSSFVPQFVEDIKATRKLTGEDAERAQSEMFRRVELWAQSGGNLGSMGKARALEGELAAWELGQTEEHCTDCLAYSNAKPKRLGRWLSEGKLPRQHDLECKGYNCDCTLVSVKTGEVLYPA